MTPILPSSTRPPTRSQVSSPATKSWSDQNIKAMLSDKTTDSETVAKIFRESFNRGSQDALNDIIRRIIEQTGTFSFDKQVTRLLLEQSIELQQNSNGTIQMNYYFHPVEDTGRSQLLAQTLTDFLPINLIRMVRDYDRRIQISLHNRVAIRGGLLSGDPVLQESIIRDAIEQNRVGTLNEITQGMGKSKQLPSFSRINLSRLDLSELEFRNADLSEGNLDFTNLSNRKLKGMCCKGASLVHAKLFNSDLRGTQLLGGNLTAADLSGADLSNYTELSSSKLIGARLTRTNLHSAWLVSATLIGAKLDEANLMFAFVSHSNLTGASLKNAKLAKAHMNGVCLIGANLHGADLTDVEMPGAVLIGADLTGATLAGADLTDADLTGADLSGADLSGAILTNAKLPERR